MTQRDGNSNNSGATNNDNDIGSSHLVPESNSFMAEFLRTIPYDLTHLLPMFAQQGIVDYESFVGLLRMKWHPYVRSWVYYRLLTELEFEFLKAGLEKAAMEHGL